MARRHGQGKRERGLIRLVGVARRSRSALMVSTALQAVALMVLSVPASAQPAPNARPTGGVVAGGAAAITQSTSNTTITQSSQRAAVNWQSFDVGAQQSVTFQQPNARAIALNTVNSSSPSQIAGRISANGQVVLVNQSGVVFHQGAQVNTAGLVVSAAGTDPARFMAGGRIVLDRAGNPNARIVNEGNITIRGAGLASLVAPGVANAGQINARLGHVVLAGARTATLDLYGDKMVTVNVTGAVTRAPDGIDSLVTNTGTIRADGGTVRLTAQAVDGVVTNLVTASGRIQARTVGDRQGRITIDGMGGSITIDGDLDARGTAPGTRGGRIGLLATDAVIVKRGAVVDASGAAGGGTVAIGTTLIRAVAGPNGGPTAAPARMAKGVLIQDGARISADATVNGTGGRVVVLSSRVTSMSGTITARGGASGGDGGFVEVSGGRLSLTGIVDRSAPAGKGGSLLLDPTDLNIVSSDTSSANLDSAFSSGTLAFATPDGSSPPSVVTAGRLATLGVSGGVTVQATGTLNVQTSVTVANGLILQAGGTLTVNRGVNVTAGTSGTGTLLMTAGDPGTGIPTNSGAIIFSPFTGGPASQITAPNIILRAGLNGIVLNDAVVTAPGRLDISTAGGGVAQVSGGVVSAGTLASTLGVLGGIGLQGTANAIAILDTFAPGNGAVLINTAGAITLVGSINGGDGLRITSGGALTIATTGTATAAGANLTGASIAINGLLNASGGTARLVATTGGITETGTILTSTLTGSAATSADLSGVTASANQFTSLDTFSAAGGSLVVRGGLAFGVSNVVSATTDVRLSTTASTGITINAGATVGSGTSGTVSAQAALFDNGRGGTITGGLFEFAPATPGLLNVGSSGALVDLTGIGSGAIRLGAANGTATATGITFAGNVNFINGGSVRPLDLRATGDVIGTGTLLSVSTLTGTINGGSVNLTTNGFTTSVGDFAVSGGAAGFTLKGAGISALSVTGLLSAGAVALTAQNITIPGTITTGGTATGSVSLITNAAGTFLTSIISGAGTITTGTLTGTSSTSINLSGPNAIGSLGNVSSPSLIINNNAPLTVTGPVSASSVFLTAPDITIPGTITTGGSTIGTVSLIANTGTIDASKGTITGGTLIGTAVGSIDLSGVNAISTLGDIRAAAFRLKNTAPLTVNGTFTTVNTATIPPDVLALERANVLLDTIASTTGDIVINTPMQNTSAENFVIRSGRGITVSPGATITAGGGGSIFLEASFGDVTGVTPLGAIIVQAPLIATSVGAAADQSRVFLSAGARGGSGGIFLQSDVTASTLVVLRGLASAVAAEIDTVRGPITQTAGAITAPALTARGTVVTLNQPGNQIGTLNAATATAGGFGLHTAIDLTVSGPVFGATSVALTALSLTIPGAITTGGSTTGTISLIASGGAISGTGPLITGTLSGSANGTITLNGAANAFGTLGSLSGTSLTLADNSALSIVGKVSASAGNVFLTTGTNALSFAAGGSVVSQAGGTIGLQAGSLPTLGVINAGAAGLIELAPPTGSLTFTLGASTGLGLPALTGITAGTLRIGAITLPGGTTPTVTAGSIVIAGTFNAASLTTLDLEANGGITQNPGAPILGLATLIASTNGATGDINLGSTLNSIGTLSNIGVTKGDFVFGDTPASGTFTVSSGQTIHASNVSITVAGTLAVNGSIMAAGTAGNLLLAATGAAADLTIGTTALIGANGAATLRAGRNLIQTGGTIGASLVQLIALGTITQSGLITADVLTGSAAAAILTNPGNVIANLGSFSVTNGLTLFSNRPLRVIDLVSASAPGGVLSLETSALLTIDHTAASYLIGSTLGGPARGTILTAGSLSVVSGNVLGAVTPGRILLRTDTLDTQPGTAANGILINAPDGMVAFAPHTSGSPITLGTLGSGLNLTQAMLNTINTLGTSAGTEGTQTLMLGSLDGTPGLTSTIVINSGIVLPGFGVNGIARNLVLATDGLVSEGANGGLNVIGLTGTSGNGFLLTGTNAISEIGGVRTRIVSGTTFTSATTLAAGENLLSAHGNVIVNDTGLASTGTLAVIGTINAPGNSPGTIALSAPAIIIMEGLGTLTGGTITSAGSLIASSTLTGGTISPALIQLQTDHLSISSTGTTALVSAPSGMVAIAPLTVGGTISVDAVGSLTGAVLSLGTRDLNLIDTLSGTLLAGMTPGPVGTQTLSLGQVYVDNRGTVISGGSISASNITINATLSLTTVAATAALYGGGIVQETGTGALIVNTVIGTANDILLSGANTIASLGNVAIQGTITSATGSVAGLAALGGNIIVNDTALLTIVGTVLASGDTVHSGTIALTAPAITVIEGALARPGGAIASVGSLVADAAALQSLGTSSAASTFIPPLIQLRTDQLSIASTNVNALISAPSGMVAIAPLSAGRAIAVDATASAIAAAVTVLSLGTRDLSLIDTLTGGPLAGTLAGPTGTQTLSLGQAYVDNAGTVISGGSITAGSVAINTPLTLTAVANTAALYATGDIRETGAGALIADTLTGTSTAGNIVLAGSNSISALGNAATQGTVTSSTGTLANLSAGGGNVIVNNTASLSVFGTVEADGNISAPGTIVLTAPSIGVVNGAVTRPGGGILATGALIALPGTAVGGTIVAPLIQLQTDQLSIASTGTAPLVFAHGGLVAITPLSTGRNILIEAIANTTTAVLSLGPSDLNLIDTLSGVTAAPVGIATLSLGRAYVDNAGTIINAGLVTAGSITINTGLSLTRVARTAALYGSRDIREVASGALDVDTLIGTSTAGNLILSGDNGIAALGAVAAQGGLASSTRLRTWFDGVTGTTPNTSAGVSARGSLVINDRDDANTQSLLVVGTLTAFAAGLLPGGIALSAPAITIVKGPVTRTGGTITAEGSLLASPVPVLLGTIVPAAIQLQANQLSITSTGTAALVSAPSGLVAITPRASGRGIVVEGTAGATSGVLSLGTTDLSLIDTLTGGPLSGLTPGPFGTQSLSLGLAYFDRKGALNAAATIIRDASGAIVSITNPAITAGSIDIRAPLNLSSIASNAVLFATGNITETQTGTAAVGLTVNTLMGMSTLGNILLSGANAVSNLGNVTTQGTVTLASQISSVTGTSLGVFAPSGSVLFRDTRNLTVTANTSVLAGSQAGSINAGGTLIGGNYVEIDVVRGSLATAGDLLVNGTVAGGNAFLRAGDGTVGGNVTIANTGRVAVGVGGEADIAAGVSYTPATLTRAPNATHTLLSTIGGNVTINGTVTAGVPTPTGWSPGTVGLFAGTSITEPGFLGAGLVRGAAGAVASLAGGTGTLTLNRIAGLGTFATGTGFSLRDTIDLTVFGAVNVTNGDVRITTAGSITQQGPSAPPAVLTAFSDTRISGNGVSLVAGGDIIQNGYVYILGNDRITLTAGGSLIQNGVPGVVDNGTIITNGTLSGLGSVIRAVNTVQVTASRSVVQSLDSRISSIGTVSINATGDVTQSGAAQIFGDITRITAGGKLQQSGASFIIISSTGTSRDIFITTGGDIVQTDQAVVSGRNVNIKAGGNLIQTGAATIGKFPTGARASTITVVAGGSINQSGSALIATTTTGSISLTTGPAGTLTLGGAGSTARTVTLTSGTGGIALTGTALVGQSGGTVTLASTGLVSQASTGTIAAGTLTSQGTFSGDVRLLGTANAVDALGGFTVNGGSFAFVDGTALSIANAISAASGVTLASAGSLSVTGNLTAASVSLTGDSLTVTSAVNGGVDVTLAATNDMTLNAAIAATTGTVSLQNNGTLSLSNTSTISAGTAIRIANTNAITLSGTLSAPSIAVNNGAGRTTALDGTTILTGGQFRPAGPLNANQLPSAATTPGFYLTTGQFTQNGLLRVSGQGTGQGTGQRNATPSILRIDASQSIALSPTAGILGTDTWLVLGLPNGARASGNLTVRDLDVSFSDPRGGTSLTGTVNGRTGQDAATVSNITPGINGNYLLNGCLIASVNCGITLVRDIPSPPSDLPFLFPFLPSQTTGNSIFSNFLLLREIVFGAILNPRDEDDLLLPLVSDQVY